MVSPAAMLTSTTGFSRRESVSRMPESMPAII